SEQLTFSKRATRYKVRKGDTVLSVADDYGVPLERLRKWNHLKGNVLKPGRNLLIYRPVAESEETRRVAKSRYRTKRSGKKDTVASKRVGSEDDDDPAPEVSSKSHKSKNLVDSRKRVIHHKVKSGETLTSIAEAYNTTVGQLKKDNKMGS